MPKEVKTLKDWEVKTFPRISGKRAFVLPGAFYGQCVLLMAQAGFTKASSVEEADVVVFIGGEDINPALYGQENKYSNFYQKRDDLEKGVYEHAQKLGKVCFGICRGAQFLHAMNGGVLWQDVLGHAGPDHEIVDLDEDVVVTATSLHHQMLQDNDTLEVIATTNRQVSKRFRDAEQDITIVSDDSYEIEIEAGCYHQTKSFFVQGHPEIGSLYYKTWTMNKLNDLMFEWASSDETKRIVSDITVPVTA